MLRIKWGRAVLAGMVANTSSFLMGGGGYLLVGRHFFNLEPANVWRWTPEKAWHMPFSWWIYLAVGNTVASILPALAYAVLYEGIPGKGVWKGVIFGLIYWLGMFAPCMWALNVMTVINGQALLYLAIQTLIELPVYGAIGAWVYGEPRPVPASPKA